MDILPLKSASREFFTPPADFDAIMCGEKALQAPALEILHLKGFPERQPNGVRRC